MQNRSLLLRGLIVAMAVLLVASAPNESATRVANNIEVLPLSPMDEDLRRALFRAIYRYDSPLFRYATQSVPPIHIIVKNGRAALKGVVLSQADSQLAYMAAQSVPGVF